MLIEINGIQCDAEGCGYSTTEGNWGTTPEEIKASSESYLNTPCPKCGASLLTEADHNAVMSMLDLAPLVTELEQAIFPNGVPEEEMLRVPLTMDGSGKIEIKP